MTAITDYPSLFRQASHNNKGNNWGLAQQTGARESDERHQSSSKLVLIGINAPTASNRSTSVDAKESVMSNLQTRTGHRKEQFGRADLAFVVWVTIIAAIAVGLTCVQIYMQNPR